MHEIVIPLILATGILFPLFKLLGFITWPWWVVLLPWIVFLTLTVIIYSVAKVFGSKNSK